MSGSGFSMVQVLGQGSPAGGGSMGEFLVMLGIMVAVLVAAGVALVIYRSRVLGRDQGGGEAGLMEQMREMQRTGQISAEEYEAMRASMRAKLTGGDRPSRVGPTPERTTGAELRARPGFDLTGAPLPKRGRGSGGDAQRPSNGA